MEIGFTYDLIDDYSSLTDVSPDYYGEFDSQETLCTIEQSIESLGHQVHRIGNLRGLMQFLLEGRSVPIVFNVAEGVWGRAREAQVPALLEAYLIPYTFADPLTMALCLDKAMTTRLLQWKRLPTAPFGVISNVGEIDQALATLPPFPLFVKPVHEGSSMGVNEQSVVRTPEELRRQAARIIAQYKQPAIIEEYLPGREFTVAVLGNGPKARVLGVMETRDSLTGFEQKQHWKDETFRPVDPGTLRDEMADIALAAYLAVECKDAARVDLRLNAAGQPKIVEVNALSGLRPKSSAIPIIARHEGMSYSQLIGEILQHALERWGLV